MVRIETDSVLACRPGKGERSLGGRLLKTCVSFDLSEAEALLEVAAVRDGSERVAPGYSATIAVRLYDSDAFNADPFGTAPLRTLTAEEVAALPSPPPVVEEEAVPEPSLEDLGQMVLL